MSRMGFRLGLSWHISTLCAIVVSTQPVKAQSSWSRQPIVLQHGFLSDAATWDQTASYLEHIPDLYVSVHRWTTGSRRQLSEQASILVSRMNEAQLPDTAVLIGHSNGGLISRWASFDRPVKSIITVGTLHGGASLAYAVLNGMVFNYGNSLRGTAAAALDLYDFPPCCEQGQSDWMLGDARAAAYTQDYLGWGLMFGDVISELAASQALVQMYPGSEFIQQINTSPRFDREQSIPFRLGVASRLPNPRFGWVVWYGIAPDNEHYLSQLTEWAIAVEFDAFEYYRDYANWADPYAYDKRSNAWAWFWAANTLNALDYNWCGMIGALNEYGECLVSDGIVPVSAQQYPGAEMRDIFGYPHMKEKDAPPFLDEAARYLRATVGVRGAPPAFYVSISGDDPGSSGTFTFTAIASGGGGNYQYRWYSSENGSDFWDTGVTSASYTAYFYPGSTWLKVVATSYDQVAESTRQFYISCGAQLCY